MTKKSNILLSLTLILGLISLTAMSATVKDPAGKWKFTAPGAPYGYDQGLIEIVKEADEYKATLSFTGMDYKFELEKVKFEEEKLSFNLYLEGEDIYVLMSFSEEDKLAGKAIYSQGEVALYATRELIEE
ncbi:MAG: hypothetical protein JW965_06565 [Bacteroidales bacterium]|nr:hypothetical protein [Bacteroidales bacterium]